MDRILFQRTFKLQLGVDVAALHIRLSRLETAAFRKSAASVPSGAFDATVT
jgi:hypothetical protein